MNKKYDNSRSFLLLTYKLYDKLNELSGPNKGNCLNIFLALLKFAWKTNEYTCAVRYSTIMRETKLSRMSVRRSITMLKDLKIIKIKRLSSANFYSINTTFLKPESTNMNTHMAKFGTSVGSNMNTINKSNNNINNNNTNIDKIISKGLGRDTTILELSKLSYDELKNDKKNSYYCSKAITLKEDNDKNKNLVPVDKILHTLKNVGGKKSNAFYRAKVAYNKANGIKPWEK